MLVKDVVIDYWRYIPETKIWFCWAYVQTDFDFADWMKKYCPTANCEFRFNSGSPVHIVTIKEEKEALIFQLKWDINDYR